MFMTKAKHRREMNAMQDDVVRWETMYWTSNRENEKLRNELLEMHKLTSDLTNARMRDSIALYGDLEQPISVSQADIQAAAATEFR